MKVFIIALIALVSSVYRVESLYFHIRETERKCFIEEVPDETLVVGNWSETACHYAIIRRLTVFICFKLGKYKVQVFDKDANDYLPTPHGIGMHVEVRDPEQKVVLSKVLS